MAEKSEIEEQLRLESEFARSLLEGDENTRVKLSRSGSGRPEIRLHAVHVPPS